MQAPIDDSVGVLFDLPKFLDAGDINEKIGLDKAHVEHGARETDCRLRP